MPTRDDDDLYEEEPEEEFLADDDEAETVPCPYCRRPLYEEAQRCPHCERYISREDAPPARLPWWMIVGFLLCLLVVLAWIAGG